MDLERLQWVLDGLSPSRISLNKPENELLKRCNKILNNGGLISKSLEMHIEEIHRKKGR